MEKIGRIGFLGGGRMAQAMAKGFISAGVTKADAMIASVHPADQPSKQAFEEIGVKTILENKPVVEKSDIVFVSVKPQVVPTVLQEVKSHSPNKLFISIAMGITLNTLEKNLSSQARLIRVMPNVNALALSAASVYVAGSKSTESDAKITQTLLESIGTCDQVDESLLDVVTALSGSGPAYVFVMIEALAEGAVRMGMSRALAYRLSAQTVLGSGQLMRDSMQHPAQLKDNVTSPGGSTAAALKALENGGFRAAVSNAVEAATIRCREIAEIQESQQ